MSSKPSSSSTGTSRGGKRGGKDTPRRYGTRRRSALSMSLNLTPMIDVVFLLLFFFLTVSQFRKAEGMLPAKLPTRSGAVSSEIPRTPLRIRFETEGAEDEACRVRIDDLHEEPMPIGELRGVLESIRNPETGFDEMTPVHLLPEDDVPWDHVVNAYNAALAARFERIFFAGSEP